MDAPLLRGRSGAVAMIESPTSRSRRALERTWRAVEQGVRTILVDSPPGAGKSTLVREIARRYARQRQVPVVVQTNDQADDMVRGLLREMRNGVGTMSVGRLHSGQYMPPSDLGEEPDICFSTSITMLRHCNVVIAPAAKWAVRAVMDSGMRWPFAIVDEAYQMRSDALLPIGAMMEKLLLVGDPGQLDPFTIADDTRFRGRALSPVENAATTILTTHPDTLRVPLPVSWRLPHHAARVISDAFYNIPFTSGTSVNDRQLELGVSQLQQPWVTATVRSAVSSGWAYVELDDTIMPSHDPEAVRTIADLVRGLLRAQITVHDERGSRALGPCDIAIGVTHRDQRDHVRTAVAEVLSGIGVDPGPVTIETANVLQGREFEIVVAWHPLSGRRDTSSFHVDAGRLCVLLTRHRQACIVVSRGGIREQLRSHPSTDPIWLGEHAPAKDGWHAHMSILNHLEPNRILAGEVPA